ncbi:hypothetical protein F5X68DRAFT_216220 [Plectosphaerella plurivora]|uniref:Uncharacterized protein n=1 Tax=Plectosphaerella plurivora TaxID=936078 RepID=A0A9P8V2R9_9PEZI|nr:hypothetical protein F5X68DRAFT_216220 [Plectosphaerella plurivora]
MDLISSIEHMNLAIDDLSELVMRHEALEYAAQMQPMVGRPMAAEDKVFMSNFPSLEASSRSKVEEAMHEVRRRYAKCKLHGVDKKFPSHALAYILDPSIGPDLSLDDQWPVDHSLKHGKFPKLLSAPDHVLRTQTALQDLRITTKWPPSHPEKAQRHVAAMKEYGIHQLVYDVGSKNDGTPQNAEDPEYIPRWLLHQLRTSPLEAHRIASIFPQVTGLAIKNYDRWQADVLNYWWRDGTFAIPRKSRKHAVLGSNESVAIGHHERQRSPRPRTWDGVSSHRDARFRDARPRGSTGAASLTLERTHIWGKSASSDYHSAHSA